MVRTKKEIFSGACFQYPYKKVAPLLFKNTKCSELAAIKHWPWVAWTVANYVLRRTADADDAESGVLGPKEYEAELVRLEKYSLGIARILRTFSHDAVNMEFRDAPRKTQHLRQICQILASRPADNAIDSNAAEVVLFTETINEMYECAESAKCAQLVFQGELLARKRRVDPALRQFITFMAVIWASLTGKSAAASRVQNRADENPPFVRFVLDLCALDKDAIQPTDAQSEMTHRTKAMGRLRRA